MPGLIMKYFVLKPAGDDKYAKASRMAMRKYAEVIAEENLEFATEIRNWCDRENAASYARSVSGDPVGTSQVSGGDNG